MATSRLWWLTIRRARPWLIAAASMLTLAVTAFAYAAYVIVPGAIPVYTISENELRALYFADGLVAGLIGLSIIFLGRAVLSNSVLTERLQGGSGLFARWRNVVGVAIVGSLFVALLYNLNIRPIYSVLLTVILAVMALADNLGGTATIANLPKGGRTATIESKTNFFAAVPIGDIAKAECTPLHRGRTTMVWQTRITRGDGKLCALVTQTQLVLERAK